MHCSSNPLTASKPWACRRSAIADEILLSPIVAVDAVRVTELLTADICEKLGIACVATVEDARQFLFGENDSTRERFAVLHREDGLIGTVGYEVEAGPGPGTSVRLSYWLGHHWQGRGYGKAALTMLLHILKHQGVARFVAEVFDDNEASIGLLHNMGFRICGNYKEGEVPISKFVGFAASI